MSKELIEKIEAVEAKIRKAGGFTSGGVCEILTEIKAIKDEVEATEEEISRLQGIMYSRGIEY